MTANKYHYCTSTRTSPINFGVSDKLTSFAKVIAKEKAALYEVISDGTNFKGNEFNKVALDFDGKDFESLEKFNNTLKEIINDPNRSFGFCCVGYFNNSKFTIADMQQYKSINRIYRDENDFSKSYLIYFDYIKSDKPTEEERATDMPDVWSCHLVLNIKITTEEFKTLKYYNIYGAKFDKNALGGCRKFRFVLNNKDGLKRSVDFTKLKKYLQNNNFTGEEFLKMSVVQYIEDNYPLFKDCKFEKIEQPTITNKQPTTNNITNNNKPKKEQEGEEEENELVNLLIEDIEEETLQSSFAITQHLYKYQNGPIPIDFLQKLCLNCLNKYEHKHNIDKTTNDFIKNHKINYDDYKSLCFIKNIINKFVESVDKDDEEAQERQKKIFTCWYKLTDEIKKISPILTNLTYSQIDKFNYQFITLTYNRTCYNYDDEGGFLANNLPDYSFHVFRKTGYTDWAENVKTIKTTNIESWKRYAWSTKYFYNIEPDKVNAKLWLDNIIKTTFEHEEEYELVMQTLAYKYQRYIHKQPPKAQHNFVFYGPKSTGKTLFGKVINKIFGEGYRAESLDLEIMLEHFNANELDRLFLNFDEIPHDKESKKGLLATMKRLSSDILRSVAKNQMPIDKRVNLNYFINCNAEEPDCYGHFLFSSKTEFESVIGKRVHIIERKPYKFDQEILNLIDNKSVILGIAKLLEEWDLTNYNDHEDTYFTTSDLLLEQKQPYNLRADLLQYEEIDIPCLATIPDCIRQAIKVKNVDDVLKPYKNQENEFVIIIDAITSVVNRNKNALSQKLSEKNYPNIKKIRTQTQRLTIITLTKEQQQTLNLLPSIEY